MSLLIVNTIQPQTGSIVNISGSLQISQSLIVADDITLSGKLTLGDANTDNIVVNSEFTSSLIPDVDGAFDLGSTVKKWGTLFAKTGSFDHLSGSIDLTNGLVNITSASISYLTGSSPITVGGAMIPDVTNTHNLGSAAKKYNDLFVNDISASGDVTSSGTGSFTGGVDAMDATGSFGYISASSDISTSGNLIGNSIVGTLSTVAQPEITSLGTITNLIAVNITASGHITASSLQTDSTTINGSTISGSFNVNTTGQISASRVSASNGFETDTASTSSFGHISASGDVSSAANVYGAGTGSFIGGVVANTATGSFGNVIGTLGTAEQTNITLLGTLTNLVTANITASGNISASGTVAGTNFLADSSLQVAGKRITYVSPNLRIPDTGLEIQGGNITASGNISASGTGSFDGGLAVVGNISSSGTVYAPYYSNYHAITNNQTLTTTSSGVPIVVTGTSTVTLPAVAVGVSFWIINGNPDGVAITVSPDGNDKFVINAAGATGTDDKDIVLTAGTAKTGDFVELGYASADGWVINKRGGTWADQS